MLVGTNLSGTIPMGPVDNLWITLLGGAPLGPGEGGPVAKDGDGSTHTPTSEEI